MTVILVFDCETTGLVPKDKITKENESYFPHIVSLSWVVYDTELKETLIEKDEIVHYAIRDLRRKYNNISSSLCSCFLFT